MVKYKIKRNGQPLNYDILGVYIESIVFTKKYEAKAVLKAYKKRGSVYDYYSLVKIVPKKNNHIIATKGSQAWAVYQLLLGNAVAVREVVGSKIFIQPTSQLGKYYFIQQTDSEKIDDINNGCFDLVECFSCTPKDGWVLKDEFKNDK